MSWIRESAKKGKRMKDQFSMGNVEIFIKDPLPEEIDPSFVFDYISSRVPFYLMSGVDIIYVGKFPEMEEKQINAYFENDAIYVTNEQDDEMDMIEDIIHEISHSLEQRYGEFIYGDFRLEREFKGKRTRLHQILKDNGYKVPANFSITLEYDEDIDMFLFQDVTYDVLNQLVVGLLPSAYAATSVSEYWAKGFEEIFIGDKDHLSETCPILYNIMINLIKEIKNNT